MKLTISVFNYTIDPEDYETEEEYIEARSENPLFPAKYEVCPRCEGTGTHTNPSIDGHGITADEWAEWDDEDREGYLSGRYDVACEECRGQRVILVLDRDQCVPEEIKLYNKLLDEKWASEAADRSEAAYFARWDA